MRVIVMIAAAAFAAAAASAQPPREQLPASQEALAAVGEGTSDEELARMIAAADAYPIGSLENPVRVGGPEGALAYIARLRCSDGTAPRPGAPVEGGPGGFGSLIHRFALDCGRALPSKATLFVDYYHEGHVEPRVPAGFVPAR